MKFSSRYDEKSSSYVIKWCKIEIIIPGYNLENPQRRSKKKPKFFSECQIYFLFIWQISSPFASIMSLVFLIAVCDGGGHDFGAPLAASYCVQWHVLGWLDAIKCEMMAVIFVGFLEPPLWYILSWLLAGHAFSFLEYLFSCKSSMMHGEYLVKDHSSCSWCLLMMPASYLHSYLGFLKCQNTKWNSPKKSSFSFAGTFKQIVLKVSSTFASKWASTFHSKNTKSQ